MKYVLISLIVFLVCVAPAWASFTFVNAQGANSSSSSSLATTTWSSTTGDMVGCSIAMFGQTISTVKDANNLSFTVQSVVTSGGSGNQYTAYAFGITANAAYKVTVTTTGGPNELSIACAEFTPPNGTTPALDVTNTATGNNAGPTVSLASVTAGDLVIGGVTFDASGAPSAGSGYTLPTNGAQPSNGDTGSHQPTAIEYNLNAAGGTTTVNFTVTSGTWAIRGTAFKAVASGGTVNCTMKSMGAGPC